MSIGKKLNLYSIVLVTLATAVISVMFIFKLQSWADREIESFRRASLAAEKTKLQGLVDSLITQLQAEYNDQKGKLQPAELRRHLLSLVRPMRYGAQGQDYYFIVNLNVHTVMHPINPDHEGRDMSGYKDPTGKYFLMDMVKVARAKGDGFVTYMWPKPGQTKPAPKLSYVRLFRPLGWVIGTGLYIDQIDTLVARKRANVINQMMSMIIFTVIIALVLIGLGIGASLWFSRKMTRPMKQIVTVSEAIAAGDLSHKITHESKDEVGQMAQSLRDMLNGVIGEGQSIKAGISVPMWTADKDLTLTFVNEAFRPLVESLAGRPLEEIVGRMSVAEVLGHQTHRMATESMNTGESRSEEVVVDLSGMEVTILGTTSPLRDLGGNITGAMGLGVDITRRKLIEGELERHRHQLEDLVTERTAELSRAIQDLQEQITERRQVEEALRDSEGRYRLLVETMHDGLGMIDHDGVFTYANPSLAKMVGYEIEEMVGCPVTDYLDDRNRNIFENHLAKHREGGYEVYELVWTNKEGEGVSTTISPRPTYDHEGTFVGSFAVVTDITERKKALEDIKASELRLRSILENMTLVAVILDRQGSITFCNDYLLELTGRTRGEVLGQSWLNTFVPTRLRKELVTAFGKSLASDHFPTYYENPIVTKDGQERLIAWNNTALKDVGGEVFAVAAIGQDITERKAVEEALRVSQARLTKAQEVAQIGNYEVEIGPGNIAAARYWGSEEAFKIFGLDKDEPDIASDGGYVSTERVINAIHEEDRAARDEAFNRLLETGAGYDIQQRIHRVSDGALVWVRSRAEAIRDDNGVITKVIGTLQDVTELKMAEQERQRLQEQLVQAQKMEAIGTLAGGIAHDFNNILGAIMGFAELAQDEVEPESAADRDLRHVLTACERAENLIGQILTFSRKTEVQLQPLRVGPIVKETLKLLRASLPSTLELNLRIDPGEGVVTADPTQIHQVILNLVTNAAQAIPEKKGSIEIQLVNVEVNRDMAASQHGLAPGPYLRLSVSDTGCGMDQQTQDRIFEPFFTTKALGEGTGMGLSVVLGIVQACGGAITVDSSPGEGSTFTIYLPVAEQTKTEAKAGEKVVSRAHGRAIFIDDEMALVEVGRRILMKFGYEVLAFSDSAQALEKFRAAPDDVDLFVTDLTMPGLTGLELAREALSIRPDLPVILCTGFSESIDRERVLEAGIKELVDKPLTQQKLGQVLQRIGALK